MKIIFISPLLSQPRCIKRVKAIQDAGYECVVYGYNRGKYDCNKYPSGVDVHEFSELLVDGRAYFKKLRLLKNNIQEVVSQHRSEKVLYYCFGLLPSLIMNYCRQHYVYENSDVSYGYPKFNGIQWLLRIVDKFIIRKSLFTVMTSQGFKEYYGLNDDNIIVQPNKLGREFQSIKRRILKASDKIRFAFVGAIRYESVFRFAEVIGKEFPQYEFHFYGSSSNSTMNRCRLMSEKYHNVIYHGRFRNPEDLETIYSNIDVVVASYDTNSLNERIAEPNKLYEALFFCKPIVVSAGTFLARQVESFGCGYAIDASNEDSVRDFIAGLDMSELIEISSAESSIPEIDILDSPDRILDLISVFCAEQ